MAQIQNSYAINTKSLTDPWDLNIKRPACPQNPDIDLNSQRFKNKTKTPPRPKPQQHNKSLTSFDCLLLELPLPPAAQLHEMQYERSDIQLQPWSIYNGSSGFLLDFQDNAGVSVGCTSPRPAELQVHLTFGSRFRIVSINGFFSSLSPTL